jgi:hypothetical protein
MCTRLESSKLCQSANIVEEEMIVEKMKNNMLPS